MKRASTQPELPADLAAFRTDLADLSEDELLQVAAKLESQRDFCVSMSQRPGGIAGTSSSTRRPRRGGIKAMKTPFNGQDFHQGKTVFLPAPGTKGIVVTNRNGRRCSKPVRFKGPHAALDWAIANAAMLVYMPGVNPARN